MNIEITKKIDLTSRDAFSSAFGLAAQQHHDAYELFHNFICDTKPSRILEIGTAVGGFTQFLKKIINNFELSTDIRSYDVKHRKQYKHMQSLGIDVRVENIFNNDYTSCNQDVIDYIRQTGTTIVLCDGGNKIKEFNCLAKYLKIGDFILAHDYAESKEMFYSSIYRNRWNWCEITALDIIDSVKANNLEYHLKNEFENVAWTCRKKSIV
jgi:hypothetical protein